MFVFEEAKQGRRKRRPYSKSEAGEATSPTAKMPFAIRARLP
jgi:hypothetical protein